MKTKVSIIIPTYNEEKHISNCLSSLDNQTYKNFEILVVDDGSSDGTKNIVRKFKNVRLIEGQHKGPGYSRNLGAKKARGDILVFIDADMTFDKKYIQNLIHPIIKDKKIIGTTHDYELATNTDNLWAHLWGKIRVTKVKSKAKYIKGMVVFRAIQRVKFLELGGFDPKYGYADDQTFWLKYGLMPAVARDTTCYHRNPENLKEAYKQSRWIGASIDNYWTSGKLIKYVAPVLIAAAFVPAIIFIFIKKARKDRIARKFIFHTLAFVTVRYVGTLEGLIMKIYGNNNTK